MSEDEEFERVWREEWASLVEIAGEDTAQHCAGVLLMALDVFLPDLGDNAAEATSISTMARKELLTIVKDAKARFASDDDIRAEVVRRSISRAAEIANNPTRLGEE